MALLSDAMKDKEYDVRMVQRNLSKGLVLQTEVDKHLQSLPDETNEAEFVSLETLAEGLNGKSVLRS